MIASHRMIANANPCGDGVQIFFLGQPFNYPRNNLNYAENFLHMCFAVPAEEYVVDPVLADAMNKIFILHAD